jgi:hypothetical protein
MEINSTLSNPLTSQVINVKEGGRILNSGQIIFILSAGATGLFLFNKKARVYVLKKTKLFK